MFVKQTEIPPEEKEQLYESKSIKTILVYKAVYLFGVAEMRKWPVCRDMNKNLLWAKPWQE